MPNDPAVEAAEQIYELSCTKIGAVDMIRAEYSPIIEAAELMATKFEALIALGNGQKYGEKTYPGNLRIEQWEQALGAFRALVPEKPATESEGISTMICCGIQFASDAEFNNHMLIHQDREI